MYKLSERTPGCFMSPGGPAAVEEGKEKKAFILIECDGDPRCVSE